MSHSQSRSKPFLIYIVALFLVLCLTFVPTLSLADGTGGTEPPIQPPTGQSAAYDWTLIDASMLILSATTAAI